MCDVNSMGSPSINMPIFSPQDFGEAQAAPAAPSGDDRGSGVTDILNNFQGILGGGSEDGGGGLLNLNIVPNILSSNTNTQSGGGPAAPAPAATAPASAAPSTDTVAQLPQAPASIGQSSDAPRSVSNNFQGIFNGGGGDAPRGNDAAGVVSNNFQGISNAGGGALINANIVPNVLSKNDSTQTA